MGQGINEAHLNGPWRHLPAGGDSSPGVCFHQLETVKFLTSAYRFGLVALAWLHLVLVSGWPATNQVNAALALPKSRYPRHSRKPGIRLGG